MVPIIPILGFIGFGIHQTREQRVKENNFDINNYMNLDADGNGHVSEAEIKAAVADCNFNGNRNINGGREHRAYERMSGLDVTNGRWGNKFTTREAEDMLRNAVNGFESQNSDQLQDYRGGLSDNDHCHHDGYWNENQHGNSNWGWADADYNGLPDWADRRIDSMVDAQLQMLPWFLRNNPNIRESITSHFEDKFKDRFEDMFSQWA